MTRRGTTSSARPATRRRARGGRRAFTLVESLMAVLIVSGVLVASLGTLGAIGRTRAAQVERAAAVQLAGQMIAEVVQCPYQEPSGGGAYGRDAGETTRADFDDVDDYDNWDGGSPPTLRDGTVLGDYANWTVKVKVDAVNLSDPGIRAASETGLKRVTVTVEAPGGFKYEMSAVRSALGVYEAAPTQTTTYLTYGGVSARVGERGKTVHGGAHPLNAASVP